MNINPATRDVSRWLTDLNLTEESCTTIPKKVWSKVSADTREVSLNTKLITLPDGNPKMLKSIDRWYNCILMLSADVVDVPLDPPDSLVIRSETLRLCPHATHGPTGCADGCITYTGRGSLSTVQRGRLRRTTLLRQDPEVFMAQLDHEIWRASLYAADHGLQMAMRLNGLSDIRWEKAVPWLFERHPDVQFYDYTKWPIGIRTLDLPDNYTLAYSTQAHHDSWEKVGRLIALGHKVTCIVDDVDAWREAMPDITTNADLTDLWMVQESEPVGLLRPKAPLTADHPTVWSL